MASRMYHSLTILPPPPPPSSFFFKYILCTDDCRSPLDDRHIIKFSDDPAIVSLLHDHDTDQGPVVDHFEQWCKDAYLHLNVTKNPKDMTVC